MIPKAGENAHLLHLNGEPKQPPPPPNYLLSKLYPVTVIMKTSVAYIGFFEK